MRPVYVLTAVSGGNNRYAFTGQHGSTEKLDFLLSFPDMRQSIIGAINELNDEVLMDVC